MEMYVCMHAWTRIDIYAYVYVCFVCMNMHLNMLLEGGFHSRYVLPAQLPTAGCSYVSYLVEIRKGITLKTLRLVCLLVVVVIFSCFFFVFFLLFFPLLLSTMLLDSWPIEFSFYCCWL